MAEIEYLTVDHLSTKDLIRIFSQITRHDDLTFNGTPCWIWSGYRRYQDAYGTLGLHGYHQPILIHRAIFAWLVHPLPRGRSRKHGELDHLCRIRACCNPLHLEFVSTKINLRRGNGITAENANKTHCKRGHLLSGDNVYYRPNGTRHCRTCANQWGREWRKQQGQRYLDMAAGYRKARKDASCATS